MDKKWTIEFNRLLTEKDTIDIKMFIKDNEIPIQVTSKAGKKNVIVSANDFYLPYTAYRLEIQSGEKNKYEMHFVTGSK